MVWDSVLPSLLIGVREGLEAGLIVSILVATLVRTGQRGRLATVWGGVLAAVAVSVSVAAVLTFTAASLPTRAQEAFAGVLSVIAVGFVTVMVFWMRRSARDLSGRLRDRVSDALASGGGVLLATAFLTVAREGLETALFLWSAARAARGSAGPLVGAAVGLLAAVGLCWGLYRRVLRLNLARVFTVTGAVLIVIAAGVFGYGLRDLQEGGVLPGAASLAVDASARLRPDAWYVALAQGSLNLAPTMTWLQVAGYAGYLVVVMTLFVRGVRSAARPAAVPAALPLEGAVTASPETVGAEAPPAAPQAATIGPAVVAGGAGRRRWLVAAGVVAVPVLAAGTVITVLGPAAHAPAEIDVSGQACGTPAGLRAGQQSLSLRNTGADTLEVYLVDAAGGAVRGEIEGLAPATARPMTVTLPAGSYVLRCVAGDAAATSAAFTTSGAVTGGDAPTAVAPVSTQDLAGPVAAYREKITAGLADLVTATDALTAAVRAGDLDAARAAWLPAHLAYARLGAAYGTFGDFDGKINGRPDGLAGKATDSEFTGFLRVEYGLWHGEPAASLAPVTDQLASDVRGLRDAFPGQETDPADLPLRAHEILENTLQFELTGDTDQGSGTNLAAATANLQGTRDVLDVLRPLLTARAPQGLARIDGWLDRFAAQLAAQHHPDGSWTPLARLSTSTRQQLDATLGQLLEYLAPVPDLLEIRKSR